MSPLALGLLSFAVVLSGCASLANTPAQDRTYAQWAECRAETGSDAILHRVEPSGRIGRWTKGSGGADGMADCLRGKGRRVNR